LRSGFNVLVGGLVFASACVVHAQGGRLTLPSGVMAGEAFSIGSSGSGKATLYIVGPGQVLRREVELGQTIDFPAGSICNAGHYLAVLSGAVSEGSAFDVVPAGRPASLSFLARPSRLPIGIQDGITGTAYVFDTYRNLLIAPQQITFELSGPTGGRQSRTVTTHYGFAWTAMDSSSEQGPDRFVARIGELSAERVIVQVPGDPCSLKMNAHQEGQQLELETDPVRDCKGNAVPDGTIVTFTELLNDGDKSTVDVPLKRGIAKAVVPAVRGATINVASGVALGNQIRWEQ
jgi:hypothetical protein